ncbi:MAG: PilZ domain-containing protein [Bryobacteraceae bacterium]
MACNSTWDQESRAPESIAGNRRADRRYSIQLDLRWKLIHRKRVLDAGEGSTLDLSSAGVRFESGKTLPVGLNVELAISWPVLLRGVTPTQLVAHGRIVRSEGGQIAIRMIQHEFRTVATSVNHCGAPTNGASSHKPFLATVNGTTSLGKIQ